MRRAPGARSPGGRTRRRCGAKPAGSGHVVVRQKAAALRAVATQAVRRRGSIAARRVARRGADPRRGGRLAAQCACVRAPGGGDSCATSSTGRPCSDVGRETGRCARGGGPRGHQRPDRVASHEVRRRCFGSSVDDGELPLAARGHDVRAGRARAAGRGATSRPAQTPPRPRRSARPCRRSPPIVRTQASLAGRQLAGDGAIDVHVRVRVDAPVLPDRRATRPGSPDGGGGLAQQTVQRHGDRHRRARRRVG